ncbi:kinase-like domain-containing protein [Xylaria bambusicola]|uniref:kinase-like domain-containing protein n=1 Tax=Xylaria bambusicola TaxID=326684 RepID=UPI002008C7AE|nr:kinase-like domain-containing protein [Xylaria bambusicola]KAI0525955.1 kinase-like domain-containing protein [Xylaria bambusicola]
MEPLIAIKLPELVRDSRLEATVNGDNIVHVYYERPGRRAEPQREVWKKERLIGSGGNGVVWLEKRLAARSEEAEEDQIHFRAVKQITSAQSRPVLEICKSELEALAKFSTRKYKRCFVRSFGWYESSGFLFIAMEYCPLGDLQQLLTECTKLPESDTREIISQVAQGLQFMHDEGFTHRDLKPGNVLIMSRPPEYDWWVKIGDMGLSKRIEEVGAGTTSLKGTPGFFAPEQLGIGGIDPKMADPFKSDIWCLGEMTFRMLRGEAVFPSHNDLRRYYHGIISFPDQRLYEIEVSTPAISFVSSAMLASPQSRLNAHQAFNHEWLVTIHDNFTIGQANQGHPVLGPSYTKPNGDPYLITQPSAPWSTISHPFRPSGIESTIRPFSMEGHPNSKVAPWPPLSHNAAECDEDSETPRASHTIRQTMTLEGIKSMMGTENHSHNPRSGSRTGTQHRTSRHDQSPSIHCCIQKESSNLKSTTTAAGVPPIIHFTASGGSDQDSRSSCSVELEIDDAAESMAKLIKIEDYFDYTIQPSSLNFLELRARRKALKDRVNVMLNTLETAKKEFDEQEKKQQGMKWSDGHSRPPSRQGLAGDVKEKLPLSTCETVHMTERDKLWNSVGVEERHWSHHAWEDIFASPDPSEDDAVYVDEFNPINISKKRSIEG